MSEETESTEALEDLNEEAQQEHEVIEEAENFKDKYFRCLAEMENMRKRLIKEQKDFAKLAVEKFVKEILQPIDHFENALSFSENCSEEVKTWFVGFQMILQQFNEALSHQNVFSFSAEGQIFDPTLHEVIETVVDDNQEDGKIVKQFTKGYKMNGKIIRPARVMVTIKDKDNDEQKETIQEDK